MQDYRELQVWQKAHGLTLEIYKLTQGFPREELYGLASQIRRSSTSIPSNIAEGSVQDSDMQYRRYLQVALGSAAEVDYQIQLAYELEYISQANYDHLHDQIDQVKKMLTSFIRKLKPLA